MSGAWVLNGVRPEWWWLFHKLWTRAVGAPYYIKGDWLALEEMVLDTHQQKTTAVAVITRVVTGDGAQLENVDITDDEWRETAREMFGVEFEEHFQVTMRFDDWLAMVRIARAQKATM